MAIFEQAFKVILGYEGEYSDDEGDRGGKTKYGITETVARLSGYHGDMKELPLETARNIYKIGYWDSIDLDLVTDQKIAEELFDVAVNMGPGTAVFLVQEALNLLNRNGQSWPDIKQDGIMGPETIKVLNQVITTDRDALVKVINGLQFMTYVYITRKNPTQEKFFRGWIKRT